MSFSFTNDLADALMNSFEAFLAFLPNLVAAFLVLVIGWIIAGFLKGFTIRVLQIVQLEPFAEKVGLSDTLKRFGAHVTAPELIAEIVKWAVFLIFVNPAAQILGLDQLNIIINEILGYIPNVIVAALILMFGAIFSDLTASFVRGTANAMGTKAAGGLSVIARYAVLIFAFLAALSQLGIAQTLVNTLFTGLVAMLALAGGLAFGLGGKDHASELISEIKRSMHDSQS